MQYFSHVFEPSLNRFMRRRPLFQCFISWSAFWTLNFWIFIGNQHKAFKAWFSLFSCYLLLGIIWNNENTHFFGTDGSVWFCISYLGHIWYIYHVCIYIYVYVYLWTRIHHWFWRSYEAIRKNIYIYILYSKNGFLRRNAAAAMFSPLKVAGHFSPRNHHPDHPVIRDGF